MSGGGLMGVGSSGIGTPSASPAPSPFQGNAVQQQSVLPQFNNAPIGDTFVPVTNNSISFEQIAQILRGLQQNPPAQNSAASPVFNTNNAAQPDYMQQNVAAPVNQNPAQPTVQQSMQQNVATPAAYQPVIPPSTSTWKSIRDARAELAARQSQGISSLVR